jgi:hypothetical protein
LMTLAYSTPTKPTLTTSSPRFRPTTNTPQIGKAQLCGIHLKWDYRLAVDLSMPGYVRSPTPIYSSQSTNAPKWTEPNYGAKQRFAVTTPTAQPFQPRPQAPQVVGTTFTAVPSISPCT